MTKRSSNAPAVWSVAVLMFAALVLPASEGKDKSLTEINPTNIATLDGDFTTVSMLVAPEEQIYVGAALPTATGRGVLVAVLDAGFNLSHPDIAANISPFGYDAIDGDGDANDAGNGIDDDLDGVVDRALGHGTFVAGMILRVAPEATILPIRVADDEGLGTGKAFLKGLGYAVDMGADIINCSIEVAGIDEKLLRTLTKAVSTSETVVVASAGNAGSLYFGVLASTCETIAAGSVDSFDRVCEFSNIDTTVASTVFAPGVDLYGPIGYPMPDSRGFWSGTSFSAGLVSGAAALARELHPDWPAVDIRRLVETAVDPVWDWNGLPLFGVGRISIEKLVSR